MKNIMQLFQTLLTFMKTFKERQNNPFFLGKKETFTIKENNRIPYLH